MIKLIKRRLQFLKNWFIQLKSSPFETIKWTLKAVLIKRFYNTFSWVIGFLIFSPALFDENPLERIRDILKWLKENFILTCFHITNMIRNKFADILNYFGIKTGSHKDSRLNSWNPFSGESTSKKPPFDPSPPKPDYEAMRKKYDQEWKDRAAQRDAYPNDNGYKFPMDTSNPYHWLYASLITSTLAITSYYVFHHWDTFGPFFQTLNLPAITLPTLATIYTSSREYIKTFYEVFSNIWPRRSGDPLAHLEDQIEGPREITLNDDRTDTKGKGKAASVPSTKTDIDVANTTKNLSQEDLAEINPHSDAAAQQRVHKSEPVASSSSAIPEKGKVVSGPRLRNIYPLNSEVVGGESFSEKVFELANTQEVKGQSNFVEGISQTTDPRHKPKVRFGGLTLYTY